MKRGFEDTIIIAGDVIRREEEGRRRRKKKKKRSRRLLREILMRGEREGGRFYARGSGNARGKMVISIREINYHRGARNAEVTNVIKGSFSGCEIMGNYH